MTTKIKGTNLDPAIDIVTTGDLTVADIVISGTITGSNFLTNTDTDSVSEGSTNLYYTDARVDARLSSGSVGNIVTTGYLRGPASFVIDPAAHGDDTGTVVIAGNLQVDGLTTTINSTTLTVDDLNIVLASGAVDSAAANGAGITVDGAGASLTYVHSGTKFLFNKDLHITGGVNPTNNLELNTNYRVRWNDSNDYSIMSDSANYIRTYIGGAEILSVGSSGINVTGTVVADGLTVDGSAVINQYLTLKTTDDQVNGWILYTGTTDKLEFNYNGSGNAEVVIDSTGKVGIGTTSPRVKLDLRSDAVIAAPTPLANAVTSGVFAIGDSVGSVVGLQLNGSSYDTYIQSRNMGAGSAAYNLLLQPLGGNVGIGTTNFITTGAKLQVKGTSASPGISGSNFTGSIFSVEGTSTVNISMGTTGASSYDGWIQVHDAGTGSNYDLLLNPIGGNVGIGTDNPQGRVDIRMNQSGVNWTDGDYSEIWDSATVKGSKFNDTMLHINTNRAGGATGGVVGIAFSPGWQGHQNWGIVATNNTGGNYTQGDLSFVSQINDGSIHERMRLKGDGNVGIGTDSPAEKLEVDGSIRVGNLKIQPAFGGRIGFNRNTANGAIYNSGYSAVQINGPGTSNPNYMAFETYNSSGGNGAVAMVIEEGGNVGIGVISPVAKLAVVGGTSNASNLATAYSLATFNITPKITSGYSLQFGSGPGDLPYIQMSAGGTASGNLLIQPYGGNVGIGTTSPNQKFEVVGGRSFFSANSENFAIGFRYSPSHATMYIGGTNSVSAPSIQFSNAGGGPLVNITYDGNVGIGTTSPDAPLAIHNSDLTTTTFDGTGGIRVHRPNAFGQYGWFEYGYNSDTTFIGSKYSGGGAGQYGQIWFAQDSNGGSRQYPLVINGSGGVSMPNQPHSYGTFGSDNLSTDTGWTMNSFSTVALTYTNNASHGWGMTVEQAGYYQMTGMGLYNPSVGASYVYIGWCVNGVVTYHWHSNHTIEENHDFVASAIRYCNVGDHITMENRNSRTLAAQWGGTHSQYHIYKLG
jgi:hypothetical protein